ncbi:MAG: nuclear transport factor 2 family protein [Candidatus Methylomirabilales bacterium]
MTRCRIAVCACLALVLSACALSPSLSSYKPQTQEEALVVAMLQRIPAGVKAKSLDIIMQAYDEDVFVGNFRKYLGVATPDSPATLRGKAQVRQVYSAILGGVKDVSLDVRDFTLTVSGNHASAGGWIEMHLKLEAGRREAKEELVRNNVNWRLRRTPLGWKIYEEIFN